MGWYVYMLRCGDGSLYTGCTNDVQRRLKTHQSGRGAKYTRSRLPVELAYWEAAPDKSAAARREAEIKKLTRQQKLKLIETEEQTMREMRRKDRQLSLQEAWEIVDRCEYAVLTMTEDGAPYGVPLNIAREGNAVYFHGAMAGRKADCMAAQPRVCLVCVGGAEVVPEKLTTRYESAILFGSAELLTQPEEKTEALRLLCLRHMPDHMHLFDGEIQSSLRHTAVWKVTVDAITGKANR